MTVIKWFMGKDTIKVALNYRKEINGDIVKIYSDISGKLLLIIDRKQKTFSFETNIYKRRKKSWYQYFEENNYIKKEKRK